MSWIEIAVISAYPEFAEEAMLAQGAVSTSFTDAADDPILEPDPGTTPLWRQTTTRGLFANDTDLAAVRATLRDLLPDGPSLRFEERLLEDQDWIKAWLQHAKPLRFGEEGAPGLWVCPSGFEVAEAGATVVRLDPGLAFGTGTHQSTALCLDWIARHDLRGKRVLDYGCGSGILAVAALKRGAVQAGAVDIDPQALTATQGNAELNGVLEHMACASVEQFGAQPVDETVDIVLANILARPLVALASQLAARVREGGHIVLAGVLDTQAHELHAAYAPWFDFEDDGARDNWVRISGVKRPTTARAA